MKSSPDSGLGTARVQHLQAAAPLGDTQEPAGHRQWFGGILLFSEAMSASDILGGVQHTTFMRFDAVFQDMKQEMSEHCLLLIPHPPQMFPPVNRLHL
ncbi:unnamed protein product [Rangifer tarandus platyrhynchus]|uniref:Uncharacterized protein n=1 Tax=Rangifer tarandus platyrhynchus TaxID=3082113 RepID=A0ABN8ZR26_RANTA|nr:unnamed protein product [Rangifer tarandus platyrhynchus]